MKFLKHLLQLKKRIDLVQAAVEFIQGFLDPSYLIWIQQCSEFFLNH